MLVYLRKLSGLLCIYFLCCSLVTEIPVSTWSYKAEIHLCVLFAQPGQAKRIPAGISSPDALVSFESVSYAPSQGGALCSIIQFLFCSPHICSVNDQSFTHYNSLLAPLLALRQSVKCAAYKKRLLHSVPMFPSVPLCPVEFNIWSECSAELLLLAKIKTQTLKKTKIKLKELNS